MTLVLVIAGLLPCLVMGTNCSCSSRLLPMTELVYLWQPSAYTWHWRHIEMHIWPCCLQLGCLQRKAICGQGLLQLLANFLFDYWPNAYVTLHLFEKNKDCSLSLILISDLKSSHLRRSKKVVPIWNFTVRKWRPCWILDATSLQRAHCIWGVFLLGTRDNSFLWAANLLALRKSMLDQSI